MDGRGDVERWLQSPGSPGYEVSSTGRVRNARTGRVLVATPVPAGYLSVKPSRKTRMVHAMVAEAFHGPRPPDHQVMHLDGTRANNAYQNLAWGTAAENSWHKDAHGTMVRGERHPGAKLTEAAVHAIRVSSKSLHQLAREFGVHFSLISLVKRRRIWRHV